MGEIWDSGGGCVSNVEHRSHFGVLWAGQEPAVLASSLTKTFVVCGHRLQSTDNGHSSMATPTDDLLSGMCSGVWQAGWLAHWQPADRLVGCWTEWPARWLESGTIPLPVQSLGFC